MKKKILIVIILILLMIPIGVMAYRINSLYVPDEEKKERTLTYRENTEYTPSQEELEIENKIKESIKESDDMIEKAHEILKKYNPLTFDNVYNEITQKNAQGLPREMESIDETAYKMLLDTYDNENLSQEEKQILKYAIQQSREHIKKIPSLEPRLNSVINE